MLTREAFHLELVSGTNGVSNEEGDERVRRRQNDEPVGPEFRSLRLKHASPRSVKQTRQQLMDWGCMDCLTTILLREFVQMLQGRAQGRALVGVFVKRCVHRQAPL